MNIKGVGIGRGVAVGPVIRMAAPLPEPSDAPRAESISAETEIARVEKSLALVNADLNRRAEEAANGDEGAKQAAPILQAIAMFASDPSLAQSIKDLINQGKTAERAVLEGFGAVEDMFRAIGGYQAERAADLHDVGQRVIADLMGAPAPGLPVSETPFVLVAEDLSPADTAALDMSKTLAIVTSQGGPTSHTAILARARGIVAVVSAAEAAELENGTNVIVNAAKGEIVVNPSEDEIAAAEAAKSRAAAAKELRGKPGATKDGHLIPLLANVGKPSDAAKALEYGAEGVGLFRTEFLFIGNSEPPSVEEQTKAYTELLSQFPGKKVVIRMLDAGADKPLPFLTPEDEPNPALGLRGLRTLRAHMDVLEGQLKALAAADAATDANLWVMAPMVADQHEADYFVKLGKSFGLKFVGAMAEVPSIALMADKVADVADFVSIGTNPVHPCRRPYPRFRGQLPDRMASGGAARHQDDLRRGQRQGHAGGRVRRGRGRSGSGGRAGRSRRQLAVHDPGGAGRCARLPRRSHLRRGQGQGGRSPQRRLLQAGRVISLLSITRLFRTLRLRHRGRRVPPLQMCL